MQNEYKGAQDAPAAKSKDSSERKEKGKLRLSTREVDKYLKYLVFIVVIGLVYIWNSHLAEKQVRKEEKISEELIDAKAHYRTIHARMSSGTQKSAIETKVKPDGLYSRKGKPPWKLTQTR